MNRKLILAVVGAALYAAACGSSGSSTDGPLGQRDGKADALYADIAVRDQVVADAAGEPDVTAAGDRADSGDARTPVDAGDTSPDSGEVGRDAGAGRDAALDSHEVGAELPPALDAAVDASEAGRDAAGPDKVADTREVGRDVGAADVREVAQDACEAGAPDAGPFLVRKNPHKWHVTSTVTVDNPNATLTKLAVVLPAPQTNAYQDVANLQQGAGTLLAVPNTDDVYVRFLPTAPLPAAGTTTSYAIAYDVTLYDLSVDFSQVTTLPPYDTSAPDYLGYTGKRDVYVDPDNATITTIANSLASSHPDVLGFAKAAYEYVASHYQYLNPLTGLHPLAEILAAGGGDCGNLASIYVSLLRHRGIPARHLVAIRPDGSYHVWADFLLQGYGWVPVDVTYKQSDAEGDYFGKVAVGSNGIIMDKQVWLPVDIDGLTMDLPLLQNYAWWYWASSAASAVTASYALTAVAR